MEFERSDGRHVVLIAKGSTLPIDATGAAAAVGLPARTATIDQAASAIAARPAAVMIEAAGWDDIDVAALPELVAAAYAVFAPVIVTLAVEQLDTVGGLLLGSGAILLCAPETVDRVAALVSATAACGGTVRDPSDEAERLRRLNLEVAQFAATLARLSADSDASRSANAPTIAERPLAFGTEPVAIDAADIRRTIRARRLRDTLFPVPGLFEDPGWDMLLDLLAAELERRTVSVSSLCIAAAVAPTTALRWIGKLIDGGLIDRRPDEYDRRRAFVVLTAGASTALRNHVVAVRRAGLTLA